MRVEMVRSDGWVNPASFSSSCSSSCNEDEERGEEDAFAASEEGRTSITPRPISQPRAFGSRGPDSVMER